MDDSMIELLVVPVAVLLVLLYARTAIARWRAKQNTVDKPQTPLERFGLLALLWWLFK